LAQGIKKKKRSRIADADRSRQVDKGERRKEAQRRKVRKMNCKKNNIKQGHEKKKKERQKDIW